MITPASFSETEARREDICEYVAQLQLHMTLQARNLVPSFTQSSQEQDSRSQLLHDTQVQIEKFASRQWL